MSNFQKKSITRMYGLTLLVLRGCQISRKKHNVTLEWPVKCSGQCFSTTLCRHKAQLGRNKLLSLTVGGAAIVRVSLDFRNIHPSDDKSKIQLWK